MKDVFLYHDELKAQKEMLEQKGYTVAYICLYGSQNYGLDIYTDEYKSDIDMKAIIVPTLDDLIKDSKPVSEVIETEWGQCDIKDVRSYFKNLLKGNPTYIETLFTDYHIVDEKFIDQFISIFCLREQLVKTLKAQLIRAMYGMMLEKQKALCHPYPSIAHKIEKFGYDGKQAHHVLRLWYMMKDYFEYSKKMKDCMYPSEGHIKLLTDYKLNIVPLENAIEEVGHIISDARELRDKVLSNIDEKRLDYSIKNDFVDLSHMIIKNKIIEDYRS